MRPNISDGAGEPSSISTKVAILTIFLTSLVINVMYNASLTSFLAVHKATLPYKDLQELYLHTNHKVATVEGSSYLDLLRSGCDIDKKIYAERLVRVKNVKEGVEKSLEGNTAFLWSTQTVYHLIGQTCTHSQLPRCFHTSTGAWAVRKDFPYTGFINY